MNNTRIYNKFNLTKNIIYVNIFTAGKEKIMSKLKSRLTNETKKHFKNIERIAYSILEEIYGLFKNKINNPRLNEYITKKIKMQDIEAIKIDNISVNFE